MVDYVNHSKKGHILTIEDPIEFVHQSHNCLVNQREVGRHTQSFNNALRSALREDPDVVPVMLEPGITPVSNWFYHRFHPEPVDMDQDILIDGLVDSSRNLFGQNQAMGTLLATRFCEKLPIVVPRMRARKYQWIGSLAYPLSGGFQQWCLVPQSFTRPILALASFVDLIFGRWLAFRIMVVLDKY